MILYNITVKVDHDVHDDWFRWMKEVHIPDVMNTGLFVENKICRLLSVDEEDGITYAFQYFCQNLKDFDTYQQNHAPALKADHAQRYEGKVVAFRTLMEVL